MTSPPASSFRDHLLYESKDHDQPFVITDGFSKGLRPDLKQLVLSLPCVDHGTCIGMLMVDGTESDKTINKNLLPEMVERMRRPGQRRFFYVADSALVTKDNPNIKHVRNTNAPEGPDRIRNAPERDFACYATGKPARCGLGQQSIPSRSG
ncbi:MAG: hypothetical protein V1792_00385 [Pseudomonadota bacterium]